MRERRNVARINKDFVIERMREGGIHTQYALAEELDMDYRYLNKLLNGKPFTSTTLQKIADQLRVRPGEIIQ